MRLLCVDVRNLGENWERLEKWLEFEIKFGPEMEQESLLDEIVDGSYNTEFIYPISLNL